MMALFFLVIAAVIAGYFGGRYHEQRQAVDRYNNQYYQPSEHAILQDLKAREELEADYDFEIPNYGMLNGQKIPLGKTTRAIRDDPNYIPPQELGKWIPRKRLKK